MRQAIAARRAAVLLPRVAVDRAAVDHAAAVDHGAVAAAVVAVAEEDGEQEIEDDGKD